ncbi:MAG TPA: hypothetical protein VFT72_16240 [Opitutaceae bacterium]|nr:hypothetical protein [Opitutaceae bacterium]
MNYQDIYSVSIANGSDVDVTFEFESGRTFNPYVDDNSANAYIYPYAYNGGDYFMGGVDNLPSGLYSVTITGPEEEFSAFWADAY